MMTSLTTLLSHTSTELHAGIEIRSGVSQGPWAVKIADIFQASGGWRAVGCIDIASPCGPTAGP